MGYQYLVNRYYVLTEEIGYLERLIKNGDKDLSTLEKLETKRREQKEIKKEIDKYNGVDL